MIVYLSYQQLSDLLDEISGLTVTVMVCYFLCKLAYSWWKRPKK